jgi:hypothetical protein
MIPGEIAGVNERLAMEADAGCHPSAIKFQRYAEDLRLCTTYAGCDLFVCPRCLGRRIGRRVAMVEKLRGDARASALDVLCLTIPEGVSSQMLGKTLRKLCGAMFKLTKQNTVWAKQFSRWVGLVRIKAVSPPVPGTPTSFSLEVRILAERRRRLGIRDLRKSWWKSLKSEGLASLDDLLTSKLVRVLKDAGSTDGRSQAELLGRWLCGTVDRWLSPIKLMSPGDVLAYQKVLPGVFNAAFRNKAR